MACTVALLALVATNTTSRVVAGVPPGPEAVILAGPAVVDEIVTPGVSPAAFVVAGLPTTVPRLAENVTAVFACATPAIFQFADTVGVLHGSAGLKRGISNPVIRTQGGFGLETARVKLALLMVRVWVALAPAALAVITSFPANAAAAEDAVMSAVI